MTPRRRKLDSLACITVASTALCLIVFQALTAAPSQEYTPADATFDIEAAEVAPITWTGDLATTGTLEAAVPVTNAGDLDARVALDVDVKEAAMRDVLEASVSSDDGRTWTTPTGLGEFEYTGDVLIPARVTQDIRVRFTTSVDLPTELAGARVTPTFNLHGRQAA